MIISDEQVRLALEYLHTREHDQAVRVIDPAVGVTPELVDRIKAELAELPDTRSDRMAEARVLLEAEPTSQEVAAKMIGRIISDSIR